MITTCTKAMKTVTVYVLTEISAKSEVFGIAQSKNMKGDKTAPKQIMINREIYNSRSTIETIRKITRNTKVMSGVLPEVKDAGLIALTTQALVNPPVESRTALVRVLAVIIT